MSIYSGILDRLVLRSSRDPIDCGEQHRHEVVYDGNQILEVFIHHPDQEPGRQPDAFLLKFPGTGGRAERSTVHPTEFWPDANVEVWTVNPPGYGGSTGRASLRRIDRMVDVLHEELRFRSEGPGSPNGTVKSQPLILWSNSLGSLAAFRYAARFPVDGMVVRNPVPLQEIVLNRKKRWHPTWLINRIAAQVPDQLNTIANAGQVQVPAMYIQSAADTVIPTQYQEMVIAAHAGESRKFVLPDAEHHDIPEKEDLPEYRSALQWLWATIHAIRV